MEGGAGTKVAMNLVGNFSVQQGTSGDLLIGLPTQMTEMHSPARILYLIDAPVARVKVVLVRRPELRAIVENEWVRFFVRDPYDPAGAIFKQTKGEYHRMDLDKLQSVQNPNLVLSCGCVPMSLAVMGSVVLVMVTLVSSSTLNSRALFSHS